MGNLQVDKKVQVIAGMSVEAVQKTGSQGQRLAARMFDVDGNGIFDKREAELFNNCTFKSEKGKLTIYDNKQRAKGHGGVIEIRYNPEKTIDLGFDYKYGYQYNYGVSIFGSGMGNALETDKSQISKLKSFDKITVCKPTEIYFGDEYIGRFDNLILDGVEAKRVVTKPVGSNDNYWIRPNCDIDEVKEK